MSVLAPLVAHDLSKAYGDRTVLDGVDLLANPGEPTGLVGENGVGKSTLLRLLVGAEPPDGGRLSVPADIGYVSQQLDVDPDATVAAVLVDALAPLHEATRRLEQLAGRLDDPQAADDYAEVLAWAIHHDAWNADVRAGQAGHRLGLDGLDHSRRIGELSGGERTRVALAALVARRPACVILDEPTNHLDDRAIEFLEGFLRDLPGVVLVASHDRVFLDNVCTVIVDLDASHFGVDGRGGNRFGGGYAAYLEHKRLARRRWEETFAAQQEELGELRHAARTTARQIGHGWRPPRDNDKFIPHSKTQLKQAAVSRRVRNVERRIESLESEQVRKPPRPLTFGQQLTGAAPTGGSVVFLRDVRIPGRLRVDRLDVGTGEHLLVTGPNGSGKSSLLALLAGRLVPDSGSVVVSARRIGLLGQDVSFADESRTPIEEFAAAAEGAIGLAELGLLHPRDLNRPIGRLSVGQQRRLALAILVASRVDLLLLDEPTNHVSLALADELEDAVQRSPGTVVIATHDRWLRRRWGGATLALD